MANRIPTWSYAASLLLITAVYVIAAKLGLALAFLNSSATPVWPPSGIALATLLIGGFRFWPAIFIGAFVANSLTQGTMFTSAAIATGNTLEAVIGAFLVRRFAGGLRSFQTWTGFFRFTAAAAIAGPATSASLGVGALWAAGYVPRPAFAATWITWVAGDAAGIVVLTPFIVLSWLGGWPDMTRRRALEVFGFVAALSGTAFVVFSGWFFAATAPVLFLFMPFPVWAAYRFGPRGTAAAVVVLNLVTVAATVRGLGPLQTLPPNSALVLLQVFNALLCLTAVPVSLVVLERERAAAQLSMLNEELETRVAERTSNLRELVESLEAFNYSVSHDLRTPLRVIAGRTQLAVETASTSEETRRHLAEVSEAARRMSMIIENLLRLAQASRPLAPAQVDVSALAHAVRRRLVQANPERVVDVSIQPGIRTVADPVLMEIVITNLIENAWKFTTERERGRIEVLSATSGGHDWIVIRDNGIGFSEGEAHELFQPFRRLPGASSYQGHGLGLATVKRIVQRHGGEIQAKGEAGKGAEFRFRMGRTDVIRPRTSDVFNEGAKAAPGQRTAPGGEPTPNGAA